MVAKSTKQFYKWLLTAPNASFKTIYLAEAQTRKVQDPREQAWFDEA